jgi:hypothetical protein
MARKVVLLSPRTEEEAIRLFQDKRVLPKTKQCVNGHNVTLFSFEKRPFRKCTSSASLKKVSLRVDTWFAKSKIPFVTAVRFIYCWVYEFTSVAWCERELGICNKTVIDWNNYLCEVCVFSVQQKNVGKNWRNRPYSGHRRRQSSLQRDSF